MKVPRYSLPLKIQQKLNDLDRDVEKIISDAFSHLKTSIDVRYSLNFSGQLGRDILTEDERAQAICFSIKYQSLPQFTNRLTIEQPRPGTFSLKNIDNIRHILNEYRSIIHNKKDSTYYSKIHSFCQKKLLNSDQRRDLIIRAKDLSGNDLTEAFRKGLNEREKAITVVLTQCDFHYIYNGILQHSDKQFSERLWTDYQNGDLQYIFIKHAKILTFIRELLEWHYNIFEALTFPAMGSL